MFQYYYENVGLEACAPAHSRPPPETYERPRPGLEFERDEYPDSWRRMCLCVYSADLLETTASRQLTLSRQEER